MLEAPDRFALHIQLAQACHKKEKVQPTYPAAPFFIYKILKEGELIYFSSRVYSCLPESYPLFRAPNAKQRLQQQRR